MQCPQCAEELTAGQYFWTHTHPTPKLRLIGWCIMVAGLLSVAVGALEVLR